MGRRLAVLALALAGCQSMSQGMSDWRPAGNVPITQEEHRRVIHECRLEAQTGTIPFPPIRRSNYASCMVAKGWEHGEPTFAAAGTVAPLSGAEGSAAQDCGERVRTGILRDLDGEALHRVLDGCLAEHGR